MIAEKMISEGNSKSAQVVAGAIASVPVAAAAFAAPPATIADVSDTVTALGALAAAAVAVVLGAMGARLAIKIVNRVAVKG
jgi:hypothetical protein